jgi:hypothetical protein
MEIDFAEWIIEELKARNMTQADVDTAHRRASPVDNWRL